MVVVMDGESLMEVFNYKDLFYVCYVLEMLKNLYIKREFCDVVLIVDE